MEQFSESLENHVLNNLKKCGCNLTDFAARGLSLGAAVSGGADSLCLLLCLAAVCRKFGCALKVITVDHRIRGRAESGGDALFVKETCLRLSEDGFPVSFFLRELKDGEVRSLSAERKNGIEEAARFLRYRAFADFSQKENVPFICLAHNEDDQIETLLMRFLQGNSVSSGIRAVRGLFIRPLLDVNRAEIEAYLTENGRTWRTDSTNFDQRYMRNRIRHSAVPFLDERFPGWKKSVLGGRRRTVLDEDFFSRECASVPVLQEDGEAVLFERRVIQQLHPAVSSRVILNAVSKIASGVRMPFFIVKTVLDLISSGAPCGQNESGGVIISFDRSVVCVKIKKFVATDFSFFAIIEKSGEFQFPFGTVSVCSDGDFAAVRFDGGTVLDKMQLPFCIRSRHSDDAVETVSGGRKCVSDILSDWHVPAAEKNVIPLVQELSSSAFEIRAVIGSVCGYEDWIVRT